MIDIIVTLIWAFAIVVSVAMVVSWLQDATLEWVYRKQAREQQISTFLAQTKELLAAIVTRLTPQGTPDTEDVAMPEPLRTWIGTWDEPWAVEGQVAYAQELYREVKDWSKVRMLMEQDAAASRNED